LCAAVLLVLLTATGAARAADPIDPFLGQWQGIGVTENSGPGSDVAFADRALDVNIQRIDQGFSLVWVTAVQAVGANTSDVKVRSTRNDFLSTGHGKVYQMTADSDLGKGSAFRWAHFADRTLIVQGIAVLEDGTLEHQKYVRILLSDNQMQLRYTRALDGEVVRSVIALLRKN
jgi:hypothetical protein